MRTISMKCNIQESKALYSWLSNHDYVCCKSIDDILNDRRGLYNREILLNRDEKTFEFFESVSDKIKKQNTNVTCTRLTDFTKAVNQRSYSVYSTMVQNIKISQDFQRTPLPELGRVKPTISVYEIKPENRDKALRAINDMQRFPVEITAEIEISKGTFSAKELHVLDGADVRELMGNKRTEQGAMYISEAALADLESWVNMQQPRKTQKEWFDTPLEELDDLPMDTLQCTVYGPRLDSCDGLTHPLIQDGPCDIGLNKPMTDEERESVPF